jgi:hypothetical protein
MAVITVTMLVCFSALWLCVLFLVPQLVDSLFRYRLWKVRDDLQGYILDHELPESPEVRQLFELVEDMIRLSDLVTLSRFFAYQITRKSYKPRATGFDFSQLKDKQRTLIEQFLEEMYLSVQFKAFAGSPFGAFLLPVWLFVYRSKKSIPESIPESEQVLSARLQEFQRLRQWRTTVNDARSGQGRDRDDILAIVS